MLSTTKISKFSDAQKRDCDLTALILWLDTCIKEPTCSLSIVSRLAGKLPLEIPAEAVRHLVGVMTG